MKKQCECPTPKPWADAKGKTTNVCETCGGVVSGNPAGDERAEGSLIIAVQRAIQEVPSHSQGERERFTRFLAESIGEDIRHKFLTWRGNRAERR